MVDNKETTSQFLQNRIKKFSRVEKAFLSFHCVYSSRFGAEYYLYADSTPTSTK